MNFLRKKSKIILLAAAVLLPVLILGTMRYAFMPEEHETCEDVYWHIAAGQRPLSGMTDKTFPITLSVWRDHFSDKELVFHLCMKGYVVVKTFFGSSIRPPFTGALIPVLIFLFAMYAYCGRKAGFSPGMLLLFSLLTSLITPVYTYRILMVRPHVLSIGLMLLAYGVLMRGVEKRSTAFLMFLIGFLYAWSYSTPHLVWIPAFFFGVTGFHSYRWKAFLPFAGAVAGVPAGFLVHPQFPNSFLIWKVQGIDALLSPVNGEKLNIPYARELLPPSPAWLLYAIPAFILLYVILMLGIRAAEKKQWFDLSCSVRAMLLLSLFWTGAMTFLSLRPVEYAVPTLTLTLGMLLEEGRRLSLFKFCMARRGPAVLLSLFLFGGAAITVLNCRNDMIYWTQKNAAGLAEKLKTLAKPGARIVNLNWGDFPEFYFNAPQFEYTWGLDPMFSYAADPERTALLCKCFSGRSRIPAEWFGKCFSADYAVLTGKRRPLGYFLSKACGWEVIYQDDTGWIFRLRQTSSSGRAN